MDIIKLVGIGLIALCIIVIVKQYKPEFAVYISIVVGIIILSMTFEALSQILNVIENYADKISGSSKFVVIMLKITGIAILSEIACSICKDCGETAIASKIDLGSKVLIIAASLPIISSLLEIVLKVLP